MTKPFYFVIRTTYGIITSIIDVGKSLLMETNARGFAGFARAISEVIYKP
jgi:hypothetical protein